VPIPLADIAPDPAPVSAPWLVFLLVLVGVAAGTVLLVYLIRRSR
jgi:hypothetical protein